MTTRTIIEVARRGRDGDYSGSVDVAALNTRVARTDPAENAAYAGAIVRNSPTGPRWSRDIVFADWYSDINAALTAARNGGQGGIVRIPKGVHFNQSGMDAARLTSGVVLEGEDPQNSVLTMNTSGATALAVSSPGTLCDRPLVRNLRLWGNNAALVGLDWRGITRGHIENVEVSGFTSTQVWFGGDNPAYNASWNNVVRTMRLTAPANGAAMRFSGVVTSGSAGPVGTPTANRMAIYDLRVIGLTNANSIAIDLQAGDTNTFFGGDIGYGTTGTVFKLGTKAIANRFIGGVSEDVSAFATIDGVRNIFEAWQWSTAGSATITTNGQFNAFINCPYMGTVTEDNPQFNWTKVDTVNGAGTRIIYSTALPSANASRRGEIRLILGASGVDDAMYICLKNTANGYSWRKLSWT